MQRKIRVLSRGAKCNSRNGFILIAAVFLMILISAMLLKMLSYTSDDTQRTTNQYLQEQAQLLAYGATEWALLEISEDDRTSSCTKTLSAVYPSDAPTGSEIFNINVSIDYVWVTDPLGTDCGSTFNISAPEQDGNAYVNVTVTSHSSLGLDVPVRFYRRTLQKL